MKRMKTAADVTEQLFTSPGGTRRKGTVNGVPVEIRVTPRGERMLRIKDTTYDVRTSNQAEVLETIQKRTG